MPKNLTELKTRIFELVTNPEDRAWFENFLVGHIYPQPQIGPTVAEMDDVRLRKINREMTELSQKRNAILARRKKMGIRD